MPPLSLQSNMSVRRTTGTLLRHTGYGKGYTAVRELWVHLLNGFQVCHKTRNMNIILLSHVAVKPFNDAIHEPYDRWEMRCHKSVNSLIKDWVDFNLFANFEVNIQKDGSKNRGVSYGNRALYTKFAAGYDAKSRVDLPQKIDFEWSCVYPSLPWCDGSSTTTTTQT